MEVIAAKDNSKLKLIRSLRLKKHRREQGLFPAEGLRLAEEAARWGDCAFALFSEGSYDFHHDVGYHITNPGLSFR